MGTETMRTDNPFLSPGPALLADDTQRCGTCKIELTSDDKLDERCNACAAEPPAIVTPARRRLKAARRPRKATKRKGRKRPAAVAKPRRKKGARGVEHVGPNPAPAREVLPEIPPPPMPEGPLPEGMAINPFAGLEDRADPTVPTATLQIYRFIENYLDRPRDTHVNRASSASQCFKRRWYQGRGVTGLPLTPRKMVNFLLGDLTERVVLYFIKEACVGPGKLYSEVDFGAPLGSIYFQGRELKLYHQQDLVAKIGGFEITAHADGWGKRNSDGQWELIEVKSASDYGFDDFKDVGPKEYGKQSIVLMQTDKAKRLGVKNSRFFFLRKQTGHLWDRVFNFSEELLAEVADEYAVAAGAEEPRRPHLPQPEMVRKKPTGRTVAGFPCTYCPYIKQCQGSHSLEWTSDQFGFRKPVYVFPAPEAETKKEGEVA